MLNLISLPYYKIKKLLINKKISVIELIKIYLNLAIQDKNNTFCLITYDKAIKQAKIAQKNIFNKIYGNIVGMPIVIKDNFCIKGLITTSSSKILSNFIPSYESTIVNKAFFSGAIVIGKTNMDEFAMGSTNTNSYFGPTINKKKKTSKYFITGGSSGGSAIAISSRMSLAAIGSDTGGSVRLPASFMGVVGFKPTYGRCSRYGLISFSNSFDQPGFFTSNIIDSVMLLESISGYDKKDNTSTNIKVPNFSILLKKSTNGMKIGIIKEYIKEYIDIDIKISFEYIIKILIENKIKIINISLSYLEYALASYYIITSAEAFSNLSKYDSSCFGTRVIKKNDDYNKMINKTRTLCLGKEVKNRIFLGNYILCENNFNDNFKKAQKIRKIIYNIFLKIFNKVQVIITPISRTYTIPLNKNFDKMTMYANDLFTIPSSLAGLPSISMPIGFSKTGNPIGIQLLSKNFDEESIIKIAYLIEKNII